MKKTRVIAIFVLLATFILSTSNCKKEETEKSKPLLTSAQVNNITATSAISGGSITSDGGEPVIARGVIWGTNQNLTLDYNTGKTIDGTGTGNFSSNLIGLTPNTTYYVNAYATNIVGTSYGIEQTFTTPDGIILLTTSIASNVTPTTASCGGCITTDGGASITTRGVVWGTSLDPTVNSNTGKTTDGIGSGNFTSSLTNLTPNTTYYIRAYASNSMGITYGNETIIRTKTDAILDKDGNIYYTVTIGSQEWMDRNLKTTRYSDGTSIPKVTDNGAWNALTTGAYCEYDNNQNYSNTYGKLYNYFTVVDARKLCPTGWHVPTDTEWSTLTNNLGGESSAGDLLKEMGTSHWGRTSEGVKDLYCFTALPGGTRSGYDGTFMGLGNFGGWWSTTEYSSSSVWFRLMFDFSESVTRDYDDDNKKNGYSVRCVRD